MRALHACAGSLALDMLGRRDRFWLTAIDQLGCQVLCVCSIAYTTGAQSALGHTRHSRRVALRRRVQNLEHHLDGGRERPQRDANTISGAVVEPSCKLRLERLPGRDSEAASIAPCEPAWHHALACISLVPPALHRAFLANPYSFSLCQRALFSLTVIKGCCREAVHGRSHQGNGGVTHRPACDSTHQSRCTNAQRAC